MMQAAGGTRHQHATHQGSTCRPLHQPPRPKNQVPCSLGVVPARTSLVQPISVPAVGKLRALLAPLMLNTCCRWAGRGGEGEGRSMACVVLVANAAQQVGGVQAAGKLLRLTLTRESQNSAHPWGVSWP